MLLGILAWSIALFYMGYSLIVPKFFTKQKFLAGIAAILLTSLVFPLIPHIDNVASAISGNGWKGYSLDGYVQVFFLSLLICTTGILLKVFINWIEDQQKKKELESEKLKSKLMVLINQNNPHFIFNVLNNIDSLITSKPAKASETINKLSGLLRYIYSNSEKDKVSLLSEIEYIENYIELQTLRLDNEITIQIEKNNISANIQVVPMLFLPFIENVFKHGLVDSTHPVKIRFLTSGKELIFECQNSYNAKKEENTDSGFGLSNIVKRLDLMYPSKYKLNIENSKGVYSVSLTLKMNED
jgi:LytS/YehU family sensor histidine kinase